MPYCDRRSRVTSPRRSSAFLRRGSATPRSASGPARRSAPTSAPSRRPWLAP